MVYIVYQTLLRQALLAWLPRAVSVRMGPPALPARNARAVWTILLSLAIGAATHIFWDAFTHPDTIPVNYFAALRERVSLGDYELPAFKILQHGSSLLGLIVMATCTFAWVAGTEPRSPSPPTMRNWQRWLAVAAVLAAALGAACAYLSADPAHPQRVPFAVITTGMAAGAIAVVLLCSGWMAFAGKAAGKG
nr:DUF4184 family protein [Massilia rubra]